MSFLLLSALLGGLAAVMPQTDGTALLWLSAMDKTAPGWKE
jgi:hypothetical protein